MSARPPILRAGACAALALVASACGAGSPRADDRSPSLETTVPTLGTAAPAPQQAPATSATTARRPTTTLSPEVALRARELEENLIAEDLQVPSEPPDEGTWMPVDRTAFGPVTLDACRTIHYQFRAGPGPAEGEALVREGVQRLAAATGLRFVYDGPVDHVPTKNSFPKPNARVELRNAFTPAIIGWARIDESDLWATDGADTLGVGGAYMVSFASGQKLAVSGYALLVPSPDLEPRFGAGLTVGNALLHELGHLVGLNHVDRPGELMQPRIEENSGDGYGPGDRRGLWALGASRGCASGYLGPL